MDQNFNWHKEVQKQWDDRADFWNESSQDMWENGSRKTILPFMKNYIKAGDKVADIGCGDGYASYQLWRIGYEVVGLDISESMIEKAKARSEEECMSFVQGDIANLPFSNDSFDAVLAINSLEWTEVPAHSLEELRRVVKKGGYLCIGILGPTAGPRNNSYPRLYGGETICNTVMPWEFRQLAEESGLEVVDGHGVYKKEVQERHYQGLTEKLQQALTFLWVFMLRK